jgi:CheY-like chemotaxis protein
MAQYPILIVDDDEDDLELIQAAAECLQISRPILFFRSGQELVDYLMSSGQSPFLIICDLNLAGENGFDLRTRILGSEELKYRSVPFVFWSTDASEKQIQHAYDLPAQGFFFKPGNFEELCDTFRVLLDYWQKSQHPKSVI